MLCTPRDEAQETSALRGAGGGGALVTNRNPAERRPSTGQSSTPLGLVPGGNQVTWRVKRNCEKCLIHTTEGLMTLVPHLGYYFTDKFTDSKFALHPPPNRAQGDTHIKYTGM